MLLAYKGITHNFNGKLNAHNYIIYRHMQYMAICQSSLLKNAQGLKIKMAFLYFYSISLSNTYLQPLIQNKNKN